MREPDEGTLTERQRVEDWREMELLRAGYSLRHSRLIAARLEIDLREAIRLVALRPKGLQCDPVVAARILL